MRRLGVLQDARKCQVTSDLRKQYLKGLEHRYRIVDMDNDFICEIGRIGIISVDELLNGKRVQKEYKDGGLFRVLMSEDVKRLIVMDMMEPVDCRGCVEYVYNPVECRYTYSRQYALDSDGNIDYEQSRKDMEELNGLLKNVRRDA